MNNTNEKETMGSPISEKINSLSDSARPASFFMSNGDLTKSVMEWVEGIARLPKQAAIPDEMLMDRAEMYRRLTEVGFSEEMCGDLWKRIEKDLVHPEQKFYFYPISVGDATSDSVPVSQVTFEVRYQDNMQAGSTA